MQAAIAELAGHVTTFVTNQNGGTSGVSVNQQGFVKSALRKNTEPLVQLSLSDQQYTQRELGWTTRDVQQQTDHPEPFDAPPPLPRGCLVHARDVNSDVVSPDELFDMTQFPPLDGTALVTNGLSPCIRSIENDIDTNTPSVT